MANRDRFFKEKKKETGKSSRWGLVGILALALATCVFIAPSKANKIIDVANGTIALGLPHVPEHPFRLGLDLQGGAELIYQADISKIGAGDRTTAVEGVRDIIERRVNALGVGESTVRTAKVGDAYRIDVELPGVNDVQQAIAMIGETPILEFREKNTDAPRTLTAEEKKQMADYNVAAKKRADALALQVKKGASFTDVAKTSSEDEMSKNNGGYLNFVKKGVGDPALYAWAQTHANGDISPTPVVTAQGYSILKRGAEKEGELFDSARHILICYTGVSGCTSSFTKDEAKAEAEKLFKEATASNFAALAKEHSSDPGSASKGGDLGSFSKGAMVKEFDDALFGAKVGEIVGPVESAYGFHIIYKTGEEKTKEYELWQILVKQKTEADILPPHEDWKPTGLSGKQLKRAQVVTDQRTGGTQVSLTFNAEGTELFRQITERNLGKPVAIFLDGSPISVPTVQTTIANGEAVISGSFNIEEARLLAQRLNTGALPVPVELVSQQTVGATLGATALQKSIMAGIYGFILVSLFMLFYYRLPGLIAVFSLGLYLTLTLAVFKIMGVTLSLSGIAGFILSLGIAVDANVLIFERLKEELWRGRSLESGVEEGFLRAWTSIRDGNTSTIITCLLLIWFGSSFVQGFAITLVIGIIVSLFTAITVTRMVLRFLTPWFPKEGNALFLGYRKK